jgi:branched-subunit amino acid transport protein
MEERLIFFTIIGMALVTYVPRLIPLLALSGKELPPSVVAWLRHVPASVLAAMLLPAILIKDGVLSLGLENLFFWAALPTLIAAILSKSLYIPVIVGMLVVILGRWLAG